MRQAIYWFVASLFLSDKLEREFSITDGPSSSFTTKSTSSTHTSFTSTSVPSNPSNLTLASDSHSTAFRSSSVQPTETPVPVDLTSPEDPDLIVLGFQELDLSADALLYSTSTAREDAWSMAIFAALGENVVLYEKVHSHGRSAQPTDVVLSSFPNSLLACFSSSLSRDQ